MRPLIPLLAATALAAAEPARPPNLLLIVADDMGYADAGFQGSAEIRTPNLDRIAREGVRLTNGYVAGAVCSPSRAGLMSGRWPQRFGHEFNPVESDPAVGLHQDERSLGERLRERGYDTVLLGKWHLGFGQPFHPRQRGFASFFGMHSGGHSYFVTDAKRPMWSYHGLLDSDDGPAALPPRVNLTDVLAQRAADWLRARQGGRPFCLALCFNAPHTPLSVDDRRLQASAHVADGKRRIYAGMMLAMDEGIGVVEQALADSGEAGRTLTVFLSDNGGPVEANRSSNHPLRGGKGGFHEGGVRVPMLWRLPGVLPAGAVRHQPVISLDVVASMAALAGPSSGPPLDGRYVLPALASDAPLPERPFFWRSDAKGAIRQGAWKLVLEGGQHQLYDLAADIGETNDLAPSQPERASALRRTWETWSASMARPAFARLGSNRKQAKDGDAQ